MRGTGNHRRGPARSGFTLIELLVVVAIIALLLGILLPALAAVRARARGVAATAQLTTLGAACAQYKADFGSMPGYVEEPYFQNGRFQNFSSTENLVVSLLGEVDSGASGPKFNIPSTSVQVALDNVGEGPKVDDGRVYGAYYSPKSGELRAVTGAAGTDNDMPEIIDGAVSDLPVCYFRAYPGANQLSGGTFPAANTKFGRATCGAYITSSDLETSDGTAIDQNSKSLLATSGAGSGANANANMAWLVGHPTLADNPTVQGAAARGEIFLLSAGDDKVYVNKERLDSGTAIDSYSDLDDFDDAMHWGS